MTDARLDALAKDVFDWYVQENPLFATFVGIHAYDHLLPDGTREAPLEELAKAHASLEALTGIDPKSLSFGKRIDRGVLRNVLRLTAFEIDELRIWESMPLGADVVGGGLFPLFLREFAPLPERMESITARLEAAPRFLEESKGRIRTPVRVWAEIAKESTERLPGFLKVIQAAGAQALPAPDRARLGEAVAKAEHALASYTRWIGDLEPLT